MEKLTKPIKFKVLSEERLGQMRRAKEEATGYSLELQPGEVAKEAQKDTLRQVREMLDGIETPSNFNQIDWVWTEGKAKGFNEAIQTIKQSLQQAIEEVRND